MEDINRILVVSRTTPYCQKAIHYGISLARKYDAELLVLHLISNPVDMEAVNAPGLFLDEEYKNYADIQMEAKEELDKVIKREVQNGFPIRELIRDGKPVDEIADVVKEEKIDLIVMLAHEEGRLEHTLFGGDKDAITRKMPCSILLLKDEPVSVNW